LLTVFYAKVNLIFPYNFWGNKETLYILDDDINQSYPFALNFDHKKFLPGSNMLSFHVVDDMAVRVESLTESEVQN
jgi:hypothetical protein